MTANLPTIVPDATTIVHFLQYRAARTPKKNAYAFLADGETVTSALTYQDLDQQAQAVAVQLLNQCAPRDRVLLAYPPGLDFIVAFFGCLYAGIIAVPTQLPRRDRASDRWESMVASSQAKQILTTTEILAASSPSNTTTSSTEEPGVCWMATDQVPPVDEIPFTLPDLSGNTIALLQYTSGSTSDPKGVIITHQNLMHNAAIIQEGFQLNSDDTALSWLPTYHDMGLIGGIIQPIYLGLTMILMPPLLFLQKPIRWLKAISRYRATISGAPNFAYDLCVQKIKPEQRADLDLSSWELAPIGAEVVHASTMKQFQQAFGPSGFSSTAFYPCYGLAESTLFVAGGEKLQPPTFCQVNTRALKHHKVILEEKEASAQMLVGHGLGKRDQTIIIVDPTTREECLPGQVGEIWLSGLNVAQGYWQHPDETQKTFQNYLATGDGPFLGSGDLGFVQEGELFITGRSKDIIIIRGRNHYPQDIEQTVQQCHSALQPNGGAAVSIEIEGTEQLVVIQEVERSHLRELDAPALIRQVKRTINEQHGLQVGQVVLVKPGSVLRTSSGKVRRQACRDAFLSGSLREAK